MGLVHKQSLYSNEQAQPLHVAQFCLFDRLGCLAVEVRLKT